ncbi:HET-like protein [Alternaria alternata]|nr:HET-like protein [Alternaria alternata]
MEWFRNRIRAKHDDIVERIRFLRVGRRGHIGQAETTVSIPDAVIKSLQYKRLTRDRTIRILDLAPGTWDEPIICSLRTVDLDNDNPRYEAISYAWGDHNDRKPVICNGCAITTTRSLFEALQRFRYVDATRTLWADALCINQADDDEKTLQVRLMSSIYTKAVSVLVWLQHEDDQVVQDSLNAICRFVCEKDGFAKHGEMGEAWLPTPDTFYQWHDVDVTSVSGVGSSEAADVAIAALELICDSPWFGRGWVIQEVALSTSASVFWGHSEIGFEWLGVASCCVTSEYTYRSGDGISFCFNLFVVLRSSHRSNGPWDSFLFLMHATNQMAFSEPKDRIYGLLGLKTLECDPADGQSFIDPDYNITTMECYRRAAAKLLAEWHDLRVLSWVQYASQSVQDWPSWVPDWSQSPDTMFVGHANEEDIQKRDISGLVQISETSLGGVQCIEISGFKVDTINREIEEYANLAGHGGDSYLLEGLQTMLRRLEHKYSRQCLACTLGNDNRDSPLDSARIANRLSEYSAFMERNFVQDTYSRPVEAWSDDRSDRLVPSADTFAFDCDLEIPDCCLFITSTEMLGIGPRAMVPGDVVVVLHGAEVPFVLRPVDNGLWRLVGECYLYDVNEGRVHREWKEKGSVSEKFTIC